MNFTHVQRIFDGSDGAATTRLYEQLTAIGPIGVVAKNLFRAQKCSGRAKVYRGGIRGKGSYRDLAYQRKQYSMQELCKELTARAPALSINWGWKIDPAQDYHRWVLYIDLPGIGQVSFHTDMRGQGPDYSGDWDRAIGGCVPRIINFAAKVLDEHEHSQVNDHHQTPSTEGVLP